MPELTFADNSLDGVSLLSIEIRTDKVHLFSKCIEENSLIKLQEEIQEEAKWHKEALINGDHDLNLALDLSVDPIMIGDINQVIVSQNKPELTSNDALLSKILSLCEQDPTSQLAQKIKLLAQEVQDVTPMAGSYQLRARVLEMIAESAKPVEERKQILVMPLGETTLHSLPMYNKITHGKDPRPFVERWYAEFNTPGKEVIFFDEIAVVDAGLHRQIRQRQGNLSTPLFFKPAKARTDAILAGLFGSKDDYAKATWAMGHRAIRANKKEEILLVA